MPAGVLDQQRRQRHGDHAGRALGDLERRVRPRISRRAGRCSAHTAVVAGSPWWTTVMLLLYVSGTTRRSFLCSTLVRATILGKLRLSAYRRWLDTRPGRVSIRNPHQVTRRTPSMYRTGRPLASAGRGGSGSRYGGTKARQGPPPARCRPTPAPTASWRAFRGDRSGDPGATGDEPPGTHCVRAGAGRDLPATAPGQGKRRR
jgi:hypothetical protein